MIEGRSVIIVLLDSFGKYTRVADAQPQSPVVGGAELRMDVAQPVVARDAAARLHPHLGGRQLDLVVKHGDLALRELEEI